jgi:hypothetical protein
VRRSAMNVGVVEQPARRVRQPRARRHSASARTFPTTADTDSHLLQGFANVYAWGEATTDRLADQGFLDLGSVPPSLTVPGVLNLLVDPADTLDSPYTEVSHYREGGESSRGRITGPRRRTSTASTDRSRYAMSGSTPMTVHNGHRRQCSSPSGRCVGRARQMCRVGRARIAEPVISRAAVVALLGASAS